MMDQMAANWNGRALDVRLAWYAARTNLTWLSDVHQFWVVVRATRTRQCKLVGQKNELAEGIK